MFTTASAPSPPTVGDRFPSGDRHGAIGHHITEFGDVAIPTIPPPTSPPRPRRSRRCWAGMGRDRHLPDPQTWISVADDVPHGQAGGTVADRPDDGRRDGRATVPSRWCKVYARLCPAGLGSDDQWLNGTIGRRVPVDQRSHCVAFVSPAPSCAGRVADHRSLAVDRSASACNSRFCCWAARALRLPLTSPEFPMVCCPLSGFRGPVGARGFLAPADRKGSCRRAVVGMQLQWLPSPCRPRWGVRAYPTP